MAVPFDQHLPPRCKNSQSSGPGLNAGDVNAFRQFVEGQFPLISEIVGILSGDFGGDNLSVQLCELFGQAVDLSNRLCESSATVLPLQDRRPPG